jgi:hypothetical protein
MPAAFPSAAFPSAAFPLAERESAAAAAILPASLDDDVPIVEGVNLPDARLYHMEGDGLSVVMVVDETMGV